MKTLRFIVMAMFAVASSMNFTACSSSDDDDNGGVGNIGDNGKNNYVQKYITVLKNIENYHNADGDTKREYTYNVSYDDIRLKRIEYSKDEYFDFDYRKFLITVGWLDLGSCRTFYSFKIDDNACISEITDFYGKERDCKFTYNENRQLVRYELNKTYPIVHTTETMNFIWEDDNLAKIEDEKVEVYYEGTSEETSSSMSRSFIFEYGNISNKGNIILLPYDLNMDPFYFNNRYVCSIVMSSGLLGTLSKNLPTKFTEYYKDSKRGSVTTYTYELDEDGFVKSVKTNSHNQIVYSEFTYKN